MAILPSAVSLFYRVRGRLHAWLYRVRFTWSASARVGNLEGALNSAQEALTALEAAREIGEELGHLGRISVNSLYQAAEEEIRDAEAQLRVFMDYDGMCGWRRDG